MIFISYLADSLIRDPKNDNQKCEGEDSSHRQFVLRGNDAQEEKCKKECARNNNCWVFSGVWNGWCIGCSIALSTQHNNAIAFKKEGNQKPLHISVSIVILHYMHFKRHKVNIL